MAKPPYTLILNDGGRNLSTRIGQTNDCSVRSLAIVTQKPYDTIYEVLKKAGRESCDGFDTDTWLESKKGKVLGGKFVKIKTEGGCDKYSMRPDLTPNNFACFYSKGRFLLSTPNHVWAYIDGQHHDLWRVKEQPLFSVWKWIF